MICSGYWKKSGALRMSFLEHCIIPDWPAPKNVRTLQTTRSGGASVAPYDSFNLGDHVGDVSQAVAYNRQLLAQIMPSEPVWLQQVHGTTITDAGRAGCLPQADAAVTRHRGAVCVVMTADCLPVLLCDETGTVRRHLNVFVNSDNVRDLNGIDTPLTRGDVVTILPAVSGG